MHYLKKMSSDSGATGVLPLDPAGKLPSFKPPRYPPPGKKILRATMMAVTLRKVLITADYTSPLT